MTKDEIKKALKTCGAINSLCVNCPYKNVENCYDTLNLDARELIIEQESEIERLKAEYEKLQTNEEILASCVRDLNHENYELTQKLAKQTRIARDANAKCTGAERYLRPFQYKADRLETKCNDLKRLSDWQREEIKRLKAEVNKGCDNCETIKQGQIDVLKELKTRHDYAIKNMGYPWDISQQIDELIKEVENASSKGTY